MFVETGNTNYIFEVSDFDLDVLTPVTCNMSNKLTKTLPVHHINNTHYNIANHLRCMQTEGKKQCIILHGFRGLREFLVS